MEHTGSTSRAGTAVLIRTPGNNVTVKDMWCWMDGKEGNVHLQESEFLTLLSHPRRYHYVAKHSKLYNGLWYGDPPALKIFYTEMVHMNTS